MNTKSILTNKLSDYPVIARYTSKQSARQNSKYEVELSYHSSVVGVHSFRFAKNDLGICVSDYDDTIGGFRIFTFKVIGIAPNSKLNTWSRCGGNTWKYNYEIQKTSPLTTITLSDFENITQIEYRGNGHVFNGDKTHKYRKDGKIKNFPKAIARERLYEHLSI